MILCRSDTVFFPDDIFCFNLSNLSPKSLVYENNRLLFIIFPSALNTSLWLERYRCDGICVNHFFDLVEFEKVKNKPRPVLDDQKRGSS